MRYAEAVFPGVLLSDVSRITEKVIDKFSLKAVGISTTHSQLHFDLSAYCKITYVTNGLRADMLRI